MYGWQRHFQKLSMAFGLLIMLSACSQFVNNTTTSHASTPTATSAPTEATQTCPAPATARAAVIHSLPVGKHPGLVYLSWNNKSNTLLRYDMTTAATITLLQTKSIGKADVSPDGQWILLITEVQGRGALQLIRIDGQQLQTLYCAPARGGIDSALLSPDQHSLLFCQQIARQDNSGREEDSGSLYLLDVTTGKLRVEASKFPFGTAQSSSISPAAMQSPQQATSLLLSSVAFMNKSLNESLKDQPLSPFNAQLPDAGEVTLGFNPWRWANSNSAYLTDFTIPGLSPGGPPDLYLLHDTRQDVSRQKSNIRFIGYIPDEGLCTHYDVTLDNRQLVCSHNPYLGPYKVPATIELRSLTGGTIHTIYRDPGGVVEARALSNSALLFIRWHPGSPETLWKINIDGSGATQLMVAPPKDNGDWFKFPDNGQPWSLASRDGQHYALQTQDGMVIGSLADSKTKTIVMQQNSTEFDPVGWSQV